MPTITFEVDENGGMSVSFKGPKSMHKLQSDFDKDLADLGGDAKTVEKAELTEKEVVKAPAQAQRQAQRRK